MFVEASVRPTATPLPNPAQVAAILRLLKLMMARASIICAKGACRLLCARDGFAAIRPGLLLRLRAAAALSPELRRLLGAAT